MSSKWLWRITATVSLLITLLLAGGFAYAVRDMERPAASAEPAREPGQPADLNKKDQIRIVAFGDSLTKGTGDANGKGYVGDVRDLLAKRWNKPVYVLNNLGINGYRTDQLLQDLKTKPNEAYMIKQADIVMLTIGANDLFGDAAQNMDIAKAIDAKQLYAGMPEPESRLAQIMDSIVKANPQAKVFYIGLYNPFGDLDDANESSQVIQQWNLDAFKIINRYPNATLVPTFDLFQDHLSELLFSDHFHPNSAGYAKIAERVAQDLP